MSIHSYVVEADGRRIVVDTGLGNGKRGRHILAWNNLNTPYLFKLTEAGFASETIDTVVCTHLHVDHVGWNTRLVDDEWVPTFPKARYLFGRTEYDHRSNPDVSAEQRAVFADSGDCGPCRKVRTDRGRVPGQRECEHISDAGP